MSNVEHPDKKETALEKALRILFVGFKLSEISGVEGKIVTGRNIWDYAGFLKCSFKQLEGRKVLDFGCGSSNIGRDLADQGVRADVTAVDLLFDPSTDINALPYKQTLIKVLEFVLHSNYVEAHLRERLVSLKRRLAGTNERAFVQADGRSLPFADQAFDDVLALQSTYQIPFEDRKKVFVELLRVTKDMARFGPIFGQDYDFLTTIAPRLGFEILECSNFGTHRISELIHQDSEEYVTALGVMPPLERHSRPPVQEPLFDFSLTGQVRTNFSMPGSFKFDGTRTMVLKRTRT